MINLSKKVSKKSSEQLGLYDRDCCHSSDLPHLLVISSEQSILTKAC